MPPPRCRVLVISTPVVSCDAVRRRMADIAAARVVVLLCHGFRVRFPKVYGWAGV